MWVKLDGIQNPIRFDGTDDLVDVLKAVLRGWPMDCSETSDDQAIIHISKGSNGYERRSPWIAQGTAVAHPDQVDAVCDLLLDLLRAHIEANPERLALHAAGVEMGSGYDAGLVVFPSTHATGKSLLTTALAAQGHRVFADDQLPVLPGSPTVGISPGFLPRLRRPLPDSLNTTLATFIRAHAGPMSDAFRYVDLDENVMAPLNTQAPIKAVVLLERQTGAKPGLKPATENEVLKACILQSFGRKMGAIEVLDHLHALVQGVDCRTLTYEDAEQAVALLEDAFG